MSKIGILYRAHGMFMEYDPESSDVLHSMVQGMMLITWHRVNLGDSLLVKINAIVKVEFYILPRRQNSCRKQTFMASHYEWKWAKHERDFLTLFQFFH